MRFTLIVLVICLSCNVAEAQRYNRFGQPRAVKVNDNTLRITPTLVLPGLFVQWGGVEVNFKQLRQNRQQRRISRWRR